MSLYDTIKSSYNLGEEFTNKPLQTKDIQDFIGGTLEFHWIDASGKLFLIDFKDTIELIKTNKSLTKFEWISNGNHGKVSPVYITKYIEVYNNPYRRCKIRFKHGIVQDFEVIDLSNELF